MDMKEALETLVRNKRAERDARYENRRYIVRVITDCGLSACVSYETEDALHPAKKRAHRFERLKQAVAVRDHYAKYPSIKSSWIVIE